MAAIVNLGFIQVGSVSNDVGVFSGQNIQSGWDSHSPNVSNLGTLMGALSAEFTFVSVMNTWTAIGQPVVDADIKSNGPMVEGP